MSIHQLYETIIIFRTIWTPEPEHILNWCYKRGNFRDRFETKVCEFGKEIAVGHLLKEIFRVTKCLLHRGTTATTTLTIKHYRWSCTTVTIPEAASTLLVIEKCNQLEEPTSYTEARKWRDPWLIFSWQCYRSLPCLHKQRNK